MAGEWRRARLGELCEFRAGCVFKPALQGRSSGDFPFVKVSDMNLPANAMRIQEANNWVSAADVEELGAKPFPPGTVVFAKIGEALRQNRLRQVARATVIDNNMMGAMPRSDRIDARFFYYALSQFDFSEIAHGTALPYLTVTSLSALTLNVPPLPEQRAIAHILGTLDDKIENLRRQSETLEAMARALFKAWFVDFEPVRAKIEGRWQRGQSLPGLPAHLYDLFPDRLVESELGKIPEGWEWGVVGDLTEVASGKRPEKRFSEPSPDASVPIWGGNGPMAFGPKPLFDEPILLTGRVGTLGFVFRITRPCWPSDNTLVVRVNYPCAFEYMFLQLRQIDFASLNRGSTQPLLTQTDLKLQRILLPAPAVLDQFSGVASSMYRRIDKIEEESYTLAALRDTLLPKLISGELRVKNAEAFLKERGL